MKLRTLCLLLAAALAVPGCDDDGGDGGDGGGGGPPADGRTRLGFALALTGRVLVVEAETLARVGTVGDGHSIVHGAAPTLDQRSIWYGNRDTSELQRIDLLDDDSGGTVGARVAIDHAINRVTRDKGATLLAVAGDDEGHPYAAHVTFVDPARAEITGRLDLPLDQVGPTSQPVAGGEAPLQDCATCPRTGVHLAPSLGAAFVTHVRNHALYRVDLAGASITDTVPLAQPAGAGADWNAPSPFGALSPDETLLAVPGLRTGSVLVYDTADVTAAPREVPTQGWPLDLDWTPDGKEIWVVATAEEPIVGDEEHNAGIETWLHIVDAASMTVVESLQWDHALNHVGITPDGLYAFVTSVRNTLLRYDLASRTLDGTAQLAASVSPLLDVVF